ncbi:hypothetical protein [Actinokineospora sp.]|uniref:hypothetical protein n=1 Tax=Actinokineospora sp. TaxID=1872133 RepID=UPI004037870F
MGTLFDYIAENPMVALIGVCEVGFWVLLGAGLLARYALRWRRVGAVLLIGTPVLDVLLLAAAVIDLRGGGEASAAHGLGAAYLGFSVAFGPSVIRWADLRVAHRFAGGPAPVKLPKYGALRLRREWREWGRCVLACAIGVAVLVLLSFVVGTPERTEVLWSRWIPQLGLVTAAWFIFGPLWTMLDRRTEQADSRN